jgi:hypothetical protein
MVLKDSVAFYRSFAFVLSLVYLRYDTGGGGRWAYMSGVRIRVENWLGKFLKMTRIFLNIKYVYYRFNF